MRTFSVVALVCLLAATAAAGETPEGREVTLGDCVRIALGGNLDVRIGGIDAGIERTRVQEAHAEFDQLLTFQTRRTNVETPADSELYGTDVLEQQRWSWDLATTRKLVTGAVVGLGWRTDSLKTNSFFATLDPAWTSAVYLSVSQPLLRGAWRDYNRSRIEVARRLRDGARDQLDATVQDVIARVEAGYWELVRAEAELKVHEASLGVAEEFLQTTLRRLEADKATRVDETQALTGVENRRLDLITAENALGNARDALRALLRPFAGKEHESLVLIAIDEPTVEGVAVLPVGEAIDIALERHPRLSAVRQGVEASEIELRRAENEVLPRLDVFGRAQVNALDGSLGSTWEPLYDAEFFEWELGLSFEYPFGNQAARSRRDRARLQLERQRAQLAQTTSDVVVGVRVAIRTVRNTLRGIEAAQRARQLAEEQLENENARLRAGVSTPFQVLQVEEDLTDARTREITARVLCRVAHTEYLRAIGLLCEARNVDPSTLEIR